MYLYLNLYSFVFVYLNLYLSFNFVLQIPWERNNSCGKAKKRGFGDAVAGNVLGSDHLSLTKRTVEEEDKRREGHWSRSECRQIRGTISGQGAAGGQGGRRVPWGPRGTIPRVEKLLLQNSTYEMRLNTDGSREISSSLNNYISTGGCAGKFFSHLGPGFCRNPREPP